MKYEFTHRFDLPPLPGFISDGDDLLWDFGPRGPRIPVDFDELERLGYVKKVPTCPTCGK